jgi:hypothetical protein
MVQKRLELENLQERMNGLVFDVEYSVDAVKDVGTSDEHFNVRVSRFERRNTNLFFVLFRIL